MLNEEHKPVSEFDQVESDFSEAFIGSVDLIQDQFIAGWVLYKKNRDATVKVGLRTGNHSFIEVSADVYRDDLVSVRSDCRCAFELKFPPMLAAVAAKTNQPVSLMVSVENEFSVMIEDVFKESTEKASKPAVERVREAFWLAQVVNSVDDQEPGELRTHSNYAPSKFVSRIHETGSNTHPEVKKIQRTDSDIPELSSYIRYTIERLNITSQFKIDDNPWEASEALLWYIEDYGTRRKPMLVPLSKKEISYCNTMLNFPGCRFSIARAHYFYLLKNRPDFAPARILNDEAMYRDEVFNWVSEVTTDLNVSDVLVPVEYLDFLKQLRPHWKERRFPFNDYFEIRRHKEPSWHVFSADSAVERGLMYLVAWLESGGNPECTYFMPEIVWKELFEITNQDGFTYFEETVLDIFTDMSIEGVRELYNSIVSSQRLQLNKVGFDAEKLTYTTCDAQGNRRHLPYQVTPSSNVEMCDIQIIGPFGSTSGLGQATRLSVLAMREAGLDPHIVNFDLDNPAPTGFSTAMECDKPRQAKVNLVHLNAEAAPLAAAYLPDIFSDSYNIGYFFWELDTPAQCHSLALEMFDEIWVSTEYGVEQYSGAFKNSVVNVGMTYEELETPPKNECRLRLNEVYGIEPDETVYLTTFDSYSFVQRKNPKAVINAFLEAFPKGDERVRLIIKTQNRQSVLDPVQQKIWKTIDNLIALDSRIIFVNKTMKYSDLLWFKKSADCYISLHRAEGWGFGMIEAMMLDVPVITTGYSGNLEFCKDDHCWLVETDEKYLGQNDYIFVVPGQKWGEPRVNHAAACMKELHEDEPGRVSKALNARRFIQEQFCPAAIGQRYADRLKRITTIIEAKEPARKVA